MPVDPEEGLVTDLMLGMMVVFGADIIAIVGFMWAYGHVSTPSFVATTGLIVGTFAAWIGWRWREIRRIESTDDPERSPLEELKHRYAAGEIDDDEFERRLDRLVEVDETVADPEADADGEAVPVERSN